MAVIAPLIESSISNLSHFNIHAIKILAEHVVWATSTRACHPKLKAQGAASDLLIDITVSWMHSLYVWRWSERLFQEDDAFERAE